MAEDQPTGTKERSISDRASHGREQHFRREIRSIEELLKRSNLDEILAPSAQDFDLPPQPDPVFRRHAASHSRYSSLSRRPP